MEMVSQNSDNTGYLLTLWYTSRTMPGILYEFFHLILIPVLDNRNYYCYFLEMKKMRLGDVN